MNAATERFTLKFSMAGNLDIDGIAELLRGPNVIETHAEDSCKIRIDYKQSNVI